MKLQDVSEPIEIKKAIKSLENKLKDDNINTKNLSVWQNNKLASYLYNAWKEDLIKKGIKWQQFLKILSRHTQDIVDWAINETLEWKELVKKIIESSENSCQK